jgi:predicted DNA-binding transcriptional regulator AlpA
MNTSLGYLRQWQIIGDKQNKTFQPLLSISSSTLWRWVNAGKFPKPYKLSERVTAWRTDEVNQWILTKSTMPQGGKS